MEKKLRDKLLSAKTRSQFYLYLGDFLLSAAVPSMWLEINKLFGEKQEKYKQELITAIKEMIDCETLRPTRDVEFNGDYTKFRVLDLTPRRERKIENKSVWKVKNEENEKGAGD